MKKTFAQNLGHAVHDSPAMNATVDASVAIPWASNERLLALVEMSPDGIIVHDGSQIVFANPAALRLVCAKPHSQIVGRPIEEFLEPPYLKGAQTEIVGNARWANFAPPVLDRLKRLDGTELAVEIRAQGFVDYGHPLIHLVIRDVTERMAAQEAARVMEHRLQQAQRMEDVGALAGGVAHEVNNMMTVVLAFSEFLLADGHLSPEAIPDVQHIAAAAQRAARITEQLLAFSRRTATKPERIDLSNAVATAGVTLQRIFGSARVVMLNTDVHIFVCVDPAHLEQVIVNLALNARDATTLGDTISIKTNAVSMAFGEVCAEGTVIPAGEYATLSVRDTGTGMSAAVQQHIFEPFFTTKPVGKGTGLGLAAVIGLLRQSGCYITLRSAPEEGAEFVVYFPVDDTKSTNQLDRHRYDYNAAISSPKGTVLFVDREESLRIIAIRALEEAGFSVVTAADSREALALISHNGPPSVVVTDIMVAAVGGTELARQLSERWAALPVILMTGFLPEVFYLQDAPEPTTLAIQKPFTPSQLVSAVTSAWTHGAVVPLPRFTA